MKTPSLEILGNENIVQFAEEILWILAKFEPRNFLYFKKFFYISRGFLTLCPMVKPSWESCQKDGSK